MTNTTIPLITQGDLMWTWTVGIIFICLGVAFIFGAVTCVVRKHRDPKGNKRETFSVKVDPVMHRNSSDAYRRPVQTNN